MCGLAADVKLSTQFDNTVTRFKTVSAVVIGYQVTGGTRARYVVRPIYDAVIFDRTKDHHTVTHTHEIGSVLNDASHRDLAAFTIDALARVVGSALADLVLAAKERT